MSSRKKSFIYKIVQTNEQFSQSYKGFKVKINNKFALHPMEGNVEKAQSVAKSDSVALFQQQSNKS